jgi:dipeptidyl aminopeptidase/acylaminoacyl peptidase
VDFDHSLNTAVKKLREALGDKAGKPQYIETLPKRGYRFIGEVVGEDILNRNAAAVPPATEDIVSKVATTLAEATITPATESRSRSRLQLWIIATFIALVGFGTATYWLTRPPSLARIVNSRALTRTGFRKTLPQARSQARLVTDGVNVYFQESRAPGLATMQVRISGGEPSAVAVSKADLGSLRDISPDGSSLLLSTADREPGQWNTWIQPLPTGPARLILKDARWPLWTPDGNSILFARNNDHELYRANADGTGIVRLATLPDITGLEISPDGQRIRFAVDPKYYLWEASANGSGAHAILPEYQIAGSGLGKWSPDGKYFFFARAGGDRDDLWVLPKKRWWRSHPVIPMPLTVGPMSFGTPTISKDGRGRASHARQRP